MKIVIAPDNFAELLSAKQVATIMARVTAEKYPEAVIIQQPLANAGEAILALLKEQLSFKQHRLQVTGPLRRPIVASYWLGDGRALINVNQVVGLQLVPVPRRHPRNTTSIGLGMLIEDAIARGATDIVLFLGASATNDGGTGMAAALGYRFFGDNNHDFIPMADSLEWMVKIDQQQVIPGLQNTTFTVVCEVTHPLLGPRGAIYAFAQQKGALPEDLPILERNMKHFALRLKDWLSVDVTQLKGGGAAGGLGAGCHAFLNASIRSGVDALMDVVNLEATLKGADLVITGAGEITGNDAEGKVVERVAKVARTAGVKQVVAFCTRQQLSDRERSALGLHRVYAQLDMSSITLADTMFRAEETLERLLRLKL